MASTRGSGSSGPPSRRAASTRMLRASVPGSVHQAREIASHRSLTCRSRSPASPARSAASTTRATRSASPRWGGLIISSIQATSARSTGRLRIDLAQQRRGKLGLTELDRELAGRQEAPSSLRRIAQLGRPSQRSDRHVKGAAATRAATRLLELQGDVLVRSGDERRAGARPCGRGRPPASPRAPGAHAVVASTLALWRTAERIKRVSEAHRALVELHDRHVSRGLEGFDSHRLIGDHTVRRAAPHSGSRGR